MVGQGVENKVQYVPTQKKPDSQREQMGDVLKRINAQYGGTGTKPREIRKTLGKDDFLRIMIAQMKNQDPTNPFKAEQMATELAQFTSVEQLTNVNQNLKQMSQDSRPLEHLTMTNLIGKTVTVDQERFVHQKGKGEEITFDLPKDAREMKLIIANQLGQTIYEKEMGEQKSGPVTFNWDGIQSNLIPAESGNYRYQAQGIDVKGQPIPINPIVKAQVMGISFEGAEPVLLVGDRNHQNKVPFNSISMIETAEMAKAAESSEDKPVVRASALKPDLSSALNGLTPASSKAVAKIEMPKDSESNSVDEAASLQENKNENQENAFLKSFGTEKGFPNGLADPYKNAESSQNSIANQTLEGGDSVGR